MELKKYSYFFLLIFMILIGNNKVDAKVNATCYYLSETHSAMAKLEVRDGEGIWNRGDLKEHNVAYINKLGMKIDNDEDPILNWWTDEKDKDVDMTFNRIHPDKETSEQSTSCPEYMLIRTTKNFSDYKVYATENESIADKYVREHESLGEYKVYKLTYKNDDGSQITKDQYYSNFVNDSNIVDPNFTISCDQLFGDKKDDGVLNDINGDGTASIAYMISNVLQYVRIIIPILIILLGSLDLARAVVAGKEDAMKKAQITFVKRLIIGLVIFFIPLLVELVMWLADIVWEGLGYDGCKVIIKNL